LNGRDFLKKISFTNTQVKILSWVIVSLSVLVVIESAWLIYLKFEKASTEIKIVEVKGEFKIPSEEKKEADIDVKYMQIENFDYKELIMNSATLLNRSSPVYIYTLSAEDSLKAIGMCDCDYLISRASTDIYSLLLTRECTKISFLPQRNAYGVYFLATRDLGYAYAKMLDLRDMNLPAFVVSYTYESSPMYSVAVGAFPTPSSAKSFFENVNWSEVERETGNYEKEYVACVAGCE
jgi:hypothetical protein